MTLVPVIDCHYDTYNQRMAAGMEDKLFFVDCLEADVVVDYGCADGTLLHHLQDLRPDLHLVGFDASELELHRARSRVPGARLFHEWSKLLTHLHEAHRGKRIALIASSVIHEIYSYGGQEEGDAFWSTLERGPFTDFILRDMAIGERDMTVVDETFGRALREGPCAKLVADYEAIWGSVDNRLDAAHFMLKYRYTDNWDHELNERYFYMSQEKILARLRRHFAIDYSCSEALPYLQGKAMDELGVRFPCPTHLKIIAHRLT